MLKLEAQEKSYFLDTKDWEELQKCFLNSYDSIVTSASMSILIKDLSQRVGEHVIDNNA